ncbi:amino acid ABC transporter permease [Coriobacteriia bacterium Es71-Z0120]|uniref:amino acid ABC transporter permease n=1 Tax=Parvivirga hydrogeniphila TaxID=2939460 RepID=UPI002260D5AC|nr:amino acid ABC transporter permease [Parvivirga hydrogeniphila]MCL4078008.1 amino acid ABC transporter permease [Parvivirga hydrogeniphila]
MRNDLQWRIILNWVPELGAAAVLTVRITAVSFAVALLVGLAVGIIRSRPHRLTVVVAAYVELFRGTPLLVQLFFIYYGLAQIGIVMEAMTAAVLGLGLNGGAYISEIVRGALAGIDRGQYDAAHALGMTRWLTLTSVILPQALRTATPPLVNTFSSMLKDTSLVSLLAITEMMNIANQVYSRTFRAFEIFAVVALVYFVLTFAFSLLSRLLERRLALGRA